MTRPSYRVHRNAEPWPDTREWDASDHQRALDWYSQGRTAAGIGQALKRNVGDVKRELAHSLGIRPALIR